MAGWSAFPATMIVVLTWALGGACTGIPVAPQEDSNGVELPPITLDWVGRYVGSVTGSVHGVQVVGQPVELLITFDASISPTCPACVTVRLMQYFDRAHLSPQTAISAMWSYEDAGARRALSLQKFTSGSTPGATLLGSISVETLDEGGAYQMDVSGALELERLF